VYRRGALLVELTGSGASHHEQRMIDAVASVPLTTCQQEGLTQAQSDCILAAHGPEWCGQLRVCPAFAEKAGELGHFDPQPRRAVQAAR
jgi:hypothetical protein